MAQTVKNLPAMQETWVKSLDQEVPLEKEMATHSNILAWRIPWTEDPSGLYSPWGVSKSPWDMTERLTLALLRREKILEPLSALVHSTFAGSLWHATGFLPVEYQWK